jgi:Immunoglobulin-like domain of bacterial spore germination
MSLTLKITVAILAIVIVVLLGVLAFVPAAKSPSITEMAETGSATTSSQSQALAISSDGTLQISLPHRDDVVSSPMAIEGQASGGKWFFEGSFPITVLDGDGKVLGSGKAHALSDWMTTGTVPFSASIILKTPHYTTGTVIFKNDNPSGLPENEKSFSIEVSFKGTVATASPQGILHGQILLSPTCPVERTPPDPACAPKPYQALVDIFAGNSNASSIQAVQTVAADQSGNFKASLAPGEYVLRVKKTGVYPLCEDQAVTINAGDANSITITCDSGIR